jgi:hypothetical protein
LHSSWLIRAGTVQSGLGGCWGRRRLVRNCRRIFIDQTRWLDDAEGALSELVGVGGFPGT